MSPRSTAAGKNELDDSPTSAVRLSTPGDDIPVYVDDDPRPRTFETIDGSARPTLETILEDGVESHDRPTVPPAPLGSTDDLRRLFAQGEFDATLELAESILLQDPANDEAASFARSARLRIRRGYAAKLGSTWRVPRITVPLTALRDLGLDPRAAFVLSRIGSDTTIDDIVDTSGLPELETLRILVFLVERGVLSVT